MSSLSSCPTLLRDRHAPELSPVCCPICRRALTAVHGHRGPVWTCACTPEAHPTDAPDAAALRWLAGVNRAGRLLSCGAKIGTAVAVCLALAYAATPY